MKILSTFIKFWISLTYNIDAELRTASRIVSFRTERKRDTFFAFALITSSLI